MSIKNDFSFFSGPTIGPLEGEPLGKFERPRRIVPISDDDPMKDFSMEDALGGGTGFPVGDKPRNDGGPYVGGQSNPLQWFIPDRGFPWGPIGLKDYWSLFPGYSYGNQDPDIDYATWVKCEDESGKRDCCSKEQKDEIRAAYKAIFEEPPDTPRSMSLYGLLFRYEGLRECMAAQWRALNIDSIYCGPCNNNDTDTKFEVRNWTSISSRLFVCIPQKTETMAEELLRYIMMSECGLTHLDTYLILDLPMEESERLSLCEDIVRWKNTDTKYLVTPFFIVDLVTGDVYTVGSPATSIHQLRGRSFLSVSLDYIFEYFKHIKKDNMKLLKRDVSLLCK